MRRLFHIIFAALGITLLASCNLQGAEFPPVEREKLLISLQRTACYGSCPDYSVAIDGRGNVAFATRAQVDDPVAAVHRAYSSSSGVRVPGTHRTTVTEAQVDQLVERFRAAGFFGLKDEYRADITDSATYIVTIDTGRKRKTVVDYVGASAGMPASVTALEDAIDETAGTRRWIEGTPEVIPLLQAEGADFGGTLGLQLVDAAAKRGDVATMQKLKSLGAPLVAGEGASPIETAIYEQRGDAFRWLLDNGATDDPVQYRYALERAVSSDNHQAFDALIARRSRISMSKDLATSLLLSAAGNADTAMVRLFLARGADPNGPQPMRLGEEPPIFSAANGISSDDEQHPAEDRRTVVRVLLAAGARVRAFPGGYCRSVLWYVSDPVIARTLIDAGADPNFRDSEGEHLLFNISDERVALVLIGAGADMRAVRPADGMTLRGWANYQKWPAVLELLDRKGL